VGGDLFPPVRDAYASIERSGTSYDVGTSSTRRRQHEDGSNGGILVEEWPTEVTDLVVDDHVAQPVHLGLVLPDGNEIRDGDSVFSKEGSHPSHFEPATRGHDVHLAAGAVDAAEKGLCLGNKLRKFPEAHGILEGVLHGFFVALERQAEFGVVVEHFLLRTEQVRRNINASPCLDGADFDAVVGDDAVEIDADHEVCHVLFPESLLPLTTLAHLPTLRNYTFPPPPFFQPFLHMSGANTSSSGATIN
jgi:hypothetical protein